ncbi:hypothetical protein LLEC1_01590 [Akanthomyces lecanii]|uniref:acylphosphatase n=1 Tax=Cordyceps confragosa TaxID=2714763 RepID=A0A179I640_CORDF|nr:hypothetical protein LLEC1_01590 [Akanthomyces lecanii]
MTRRVYFIAHGGTVQGVGFRYVGYMILPKCTFGLSVLMKNTRYFTRKKAQAYGLTGWCRNTPDNKVEGEVQGEDASVDKLLKDVDQGPSGASVVKLTQEERDVVADETAFAVRH